MLGRIPKVIIWFFFLFWVTLLTHEYGKCVFYNKSLISFSGTEKII